MWIGTWNVNGQLLREDVVKWIRNTSELSTDMYVLGLEEMVPLNLWTILFERGVESKREEWIQVVLEVLQTFTRFHLSVFRQYRWLGYS